MTDINNRLNRLYDAVGKTADADINRYPGIVQKNTPTSLHINFSGGRTQEDLENILQTLISNIASLYEHLRTWAASNGKDVEIVNKAFDGSIDLKIVMDLWNVDKHPHKRRDGGYSKKHPKLVYVNAVMNVDETTEPLTMQPLYDDEGKIVCYVPGHATLLVAADVADDAGNRIGRFNDIADRAIEVWENLIGRLK